MNPIAPRAEGPWAFLGKGRIMKANVIGLLAVVVVLAVTGTAAQAVDFVLMDSEHLDVVAYHATGTLFNTSTADVLAGGSIQNAYVNGEAILYVRSGGSVGDLYAYGSSTTNVAGGSVYELNAYNTSNFDMSGGNVANHLYARDSSSVDVSGGNIPYLYAHNSSSMDISGGSVSNLYATNTSTITLHGNHFQSTAGLSLVEYDVIGGVPQYDVVGTGILAGKWADGTAWMINVNQNDGGATIQAVPEPAMLSLLALGGLALLRRRSPGRASDD